MIGTIKASTNQKNDKKVMSYPRKAKVILLVVSNECQSKREMTKGYALFSKGRKDLSWDELQELRKLL